MGFLIELILFFLTEVDSVSLLNEDSFTIKGYKTVLPKRKEVDSKIRIVALIKAAVWSKINCGSTV